MGLKPDTWIREMALELSMIEPFVDGQVRNGVISYGLSSYGYDIRVSDEFKVFTPGMGDLSLVDPKHLATQAMVDFRGDVCIIPPNSFALARSLEYMRIPRNVLGTVLGKSTYARCFRGDTRVALVDGTAPTLEDMAVRAEQGECFWGYSVGQFGRIVVTLLDAPRYVGRDPLLEVTLDNGATIYSTPDHQFLTRDGHMMAACDLQPDVALMPLYRNLVGGYEAVYQPLNGYLHPTHRLADEWNMRHGVYTDSPGTHRHHRDHNRLNNVPLNLVCMEQSEHIRLHNADDSGDDSDPDGHSAVVCAALAWLSEDPAGHAQFAEAQHKRKRQTMCEVRAGAGITDDVVHSALDGTDSIRGAARLLESDRSVFRRFPQVVRAFKGLPEADNHRVIAIKSLPGEHDVYCLSVPETGNFALEAGVFVHNCGIVTNFTPLEPGWHGHITIEISNTTPLPAKIYANEGIAQVLFFEGDEPCEVSYADKQGKYQGQQGVVLPRL